MTLDSRIMRRIGFQTLFDPTLYENLGFKLHVRLDGWARDLVEAICEHGVGHPIPESIIERDINGPMGAKGTWGAHGCDGCCTKFPIKEKQ